MIDGITAENLHSRLRKSQCCCTLLLMTYKLHKCLIMLILCFPKTNERCILMATGFDGMWQTFQVRCHRMVIFRCFGVQGILRWLQSFVWLIGLPPLRNDCCLVDDIRGLKQSGRQRQGRLRLKNECLPLIRISKMAAFLLIRRHTSTSA